MSLDLRVKRWAGVTLLLFYSLWSILAFFFTEEAIRGKDHLNIKRLNSREKEEEMKSREEKKKPVKNDQAYSSRPSLSTQSVCKVWVTGERTSLLLLQRLYFISIKETQEKTPTKKTNFTLDNLDCQESCHQHFDPEVKQESTGQMTMCQAMIACQTSSPEQPSTQAVLGNQPLLPSEPHEQQTRTARVRQHRPDWDINDNNIPRVSSFQFLSFSLFFFLTLLVQTISLQRNHSWFIVTKYSRSEKITSPVTFFSYGQIEIYTFYKRTLQRNPYFWTKFVM